MPMKVFAGIDGGGTRTRLVLAQEDGTVFGLVEGPCCSFAELGLEQARQSLAELWRAGWKCANTPPRPADGLFIGTGSVLSEEDERVNCDLAAGLHFAPPGKIRAGNDAFNALVGSLGGHPGILLISGTGSACLGRNARGETWRAGGWGHLLKDAGSAHALGMGAIIAATRDADGRGPRTTLTGIVCEALGLRELKEIYRKVHAGGVSRADIASLAPRVLAQADAGDRVAQDLEREAVEGLVEMVVTVAKRLGLAQPELALTGGLITNAHRFRQSFLDRLSRVLPGFTLASDGLAPVFGAVLLAFETGLGHPPPPSFIDNLRGRNALHEQRCIS